MPIRFAYFDASGTMIQPKISVGAVYARAGAKHGLEAEPKELEAAFRRVWPEYTKPGAGGPLSGLADEAATFAWWRGLVLGVLDQVGCGGDREAVFQACYDAFSEAEAWHVYDDVVPTLEGFNARGVSMGVLSNWDPRLGRVLENVGLARYFREWVVSALVGVEKPHPKIFEIACARAGLSPDEVLYVGDNVMLDLDPAVELGFHAYLIDRPGRSDSPRAIRTLETLLGIYDATA